MDLSNYLGDLLAKGVYREVYSHKKDDNLVIKKQVNSKQDCNKLEWELWKIIKNTKYKNSFCPCIDISKDNKFLVMRRAESPIDPYRNNGLTSNKGLLEKLRKLDNPPIPSGMKDIFTSGNPQNLKIWNWGILEGRKVIVDYGNKYNTCLLKRLSNTSS